ncbi:MAG TPA: endolytic transglycosylase MltG [Actinomycetota bacterium]
MIDADVGTDQHPPEPPKKKRRWLRWLVLLILLAVLGAGGVAGYGIWAMGGTDSGEAVTVEIPKGASGARIAAILEEAEVVRSALVFRLVARLRSVDTGLKPGVYEMREGLGVEGVIDLLQQGIEPKFVRITVPEGKTVIEIARIVGDGTHITEGEFLQEARSGRHRIGLMPKGSKNLEGLLFPKTYDVTEEMDAGDVIQRMLGQFEKETAELDLARAERLGVTPYEAAIIASLIEREAKVQKDRPLVSSVIYNRLRRPMRLQIDATVQYAILLRDGEYERNLTQDHYTDVRSPYNTYLIDGLPPAPIASAGLASLDAALNPADTDFYFYRLSSDGRSHCFSRDSAGHARCASR